MKTLLVALTVLASFNSFAITPNEEARKRVEIRDWSRELKRELQITIVQYNQATGVHKINLENKINDIQDKLAILLGHKQSCK